MFIKNYKMLISIFAACVYLSACNMSSFSEFSLESVGHAQEAKQPKNQPDDVTLAERFKEDQAEINRLIETHDFVGLIRSVDEIPTRWQPTDNRYFYLMTDICSAFESYDFKDTQQYVLAHKCAKRVLENADAMPINLEKLMNENLQGVREYILGIVPLDDWKADRAERVKLLLHLWQRVENNIDRDFKVKALQNRPIGNVPVPDGAYPAGINPEDIKEPEIRARYEAAREANLIKAQKFSLQIQLHRIDEELPQYVEKRLVDMYSMPPFDLDQLRNDLQEFKLDSVKSQRIVNAVTQEMKQAKIM